MDSEEIYQNIIEDYETFISAKLESIKGLATALPDTVIIFVMKFKDNIPVQTICNIIQQMEVYLASRISDKSIAIIPIMGAEQNDIEIILPHAPLDRFIKLEERCKYLESRVLEIEEKI